MIVSKAIPIPASSMLVDWTWFRLKSQRTCKKQLLKMFWVIFVSSSLSHVCSNVGLGLGDETVSRLVKHVCRRDHMAPHHDHYCADCFSKILWIHICSVGESGDTSSMFTYTLC